jgi:hypothetical protein
VLRHTLQYPTCPGPHYHVTKSEGILSRHEEEKAMNYSFYTASFLGLEYRLYELNPLLDFLITLRSLLNYSLKNALAIHLVYLCNIAFRSLSPFGQTEPVYGGY